jgi:PAS domain S-box-containing protein
MAGCKVLVVEDENLIAMDLQRRLEGLGYSVTGTAGTGEAAMRLARATHPDIVLMDIVLRGPIDGIELSARMRSELDIPVVYVTAHSDEKTVSRAKATGPYGYVTKPVDDRQLQIVIEMAVYKHSSEKALRDSEERFRQLAEATSEGMLVHDGRAVLDLNTRMAAMLGYAPADVAGLGLSELVAPQPGDGKPAPARFGEDGPFEAAMRRKDGSSFPVEVAGRSIPYRGRQVRVSSVRDITQRREMERLIKERARSELYGFVVSALPLIAPGALQTVREDLLRIFGDRFEAYFKPSYIAGPGGARERTGGADLSRYLGWAQGLFSNFGIAVESSARDGQAILEFQSCPWLEYSRKNPVFCVLCQTMASRSFAWECRGGAVGVRGTIAGGGRRCRFELRPQGAGNEHRKGGRGS